MGVSNYKLYLRSIGIISDIAKVDSTIAEQSLLLSIYQGNILEEDINTRIERATRTKNVIAISIILSSNPKLSYGEASLILKEQPILRIAIQKCVKQS